MIYFPEPHSQSKKKQNIKLHLDFTNYATKSDLKGATGINTSKFAKNADLASWKSDIEEIVGN